MLPIVIDMMILGLILSGLVIGLATAIKQIAIPWIRGQKAFPHLRDPVVKIRDESARQLALAEARYQEAIVAEEIRIKEAKTNNLIFNLGSGAIEDAVARENYRRAEELDEKAARLRAGASIFDPIPNLSTDSEKEQGSRKRIKE